jgi:CheY-like chemotaxis protein
MDDSEEIKPDFVASLYDMYNINIPMVLITDNENYQSKEKLLNSGVAKQVLNRPVSLREIDNAIQVSLV